MTERNGKKQIKIAGFLNMRKSERDYLAAFAKTHFNMSVSREGAIQKNVPFGKIQAFVRMVGYHWRVISLEK